jgi:hypothetical protein
MIQCNVASISKTWGINSNLLCSVKVRYTVCAKSCFVPVLHSSGTSLRLNCHVSLQTQSGTYMHLKCVCVCVCMCVCVCVCVRGAFVTLAVT